jgi:hypothetical protein
MRKKKIVEKGKNNRTANAERHKKDTSLHLCAFALNRLNGLRAKDRSKNLS